MSEEIQKLIAQYTKASETIPSAGIVLSEDLIVLHTNKKAKKLLEKLGMDYKKETSLFDQIPEFAKLHPNFSLSDFEKEFILEDWYCDNTYYLQFYFTKTIIDDVLLSMLFIIDKTASVRRKEERLLLLKERDYIIKERDRLLSVISHDLLPPFNAILGFIDMAITTKDLKHLPIVLKSVQSMLDQLKGLLELSNKEGKESKEDAEIKKEFNLNDLVQEMIQVNSPVALSQNIRFVNGVDKSIVLFTNEVKLGSILSNLINNAIKFSHKDSNISILSIIEDNTIDIVVLDKGIGMTQKE